MTIADTGFPGSPNAGTGPAIPNHVGCPGRIATRQKCSSTPSEANAPFTWSCSPTDTPPDTHTMSESASARESATRVASAESGTVSLNTTSPPARATWAPTVSGFELQIRPGAGSDPGGASSSPVASTATRGRRAHAAAPRPTLASTPSSAGPSSVPWVSTVVPARTSSPARRMFAPSSGVPTSTRPPAISVRSTGTTVAAPSGTTAPVEMRIASPASSAPANGCPARDSPTTGRAPVAPGPTAKPSMAELSNGGTSTSLCTSSASTRPSASATGTSAASSGTIWASTKRRASSMPIGSATHGIIPPRRCVRWPRPPRRPLRA